MIIPFLKKIALWIIVIVIVIVIIPFFMVGKKKISHTVSVYISDMDKVVNMDFEKYIEGVVRAEMPASFHIEALKAQSVATRSYTIKKINSNQNNKEIHKGASVCTLPEHCQAYKSEEDMKKTWGKNAKQYNKKIKDAVNSTSNKIIVYEDEVINAVFHASNGGKTENSHEVWGGNVAYLKSTQSFGEEEAPKFKTSASYHIDEFKNIILQNAPDTVFENIIGEKTLTEGGSVKTINIGNKTFSGTDIRKMFKLNSANFDIIEQENKITFNVTGYGHGVGMSQYGANKMAKMGKSYEEIIKNYYHNVEISEYIKP
ncbi:MAG: stage II sporulation protein D [Ruminococcaceae bacterium]|nr:stage II sporulation protein D [Oscillospiraceae bacterium]